MEAALGWGAVAASSLVIGAGLAFARRWPAWQLGLVLAFGAGALISAVSFELAAEGLAVGSLGATAAGLAIGALTYFGLDGLIAKRFSAGRGRSGRIGLLVAIFVSNLPEAIGSASEMRTAGISGRRVLLLWGAVAAICILASAVGFAIADATSGELRAGIDGFAAGALLVMLIDSMIPEASRDSGRVAGLVTTIGFAVATALSSLS